jgi:hypothetical protein
VKANRTLSLVGRLSGPETDVLYSKCVRACLAWVGTASGLVVARNNTMTTSSTRSLATDGLRRIGDEPTVKISRSWVGAYVARFFSLGLGWCRDRLAGPTAAPNLWVHAHLRAVAATGE